MRQQQVVFALAVLALVSACATPSEVTVVRTVPPKFSIVPAKVITVVRGPQTRKVPDADEETFLDLVITTLRRSGTYEVIDGRYAAAGMHPDVVLRISLGDYCRTEVVRGSVQSTPYGIYEEFAGVCEAAIDLVNAHGGTSLGHAEVRGTSRNTNYGVALRQARNDAAQQLIDTFMPGSQHETIALDPTAPSFAAGVRKIKKGDLAGARGVWQDALQAEPDSAPLLYNLGAVSEAMREPDAAGPYYLKATKLAPTDTRYREALDKLNERLDDEETAAMTAEALKAEETARHHQAPQFCAWACGGLPSLSWARPVP